MTRCYSIARSKFRMSREESSCSIDDDSSALQAYSSSLRREGHEVRAFASFSEGLSCLESEHFDLIVVKLKEVSSLNDERFWTVESRFPATGLACYWHAVSTGLATWLWRTWDNRSN